MSAIEPSRLAGENALVLSDSLRVKRFERTGVDGVTALLGLTLWTPHQFPAQARPTLVLARETRSLEKFAHAFPPRAVSISRGGAAQPGWWQWRGTYAIPQEYCDHGRFAFWLDDRPALELPWPSDLPRVLADAGGDRSGRVVARVLRGALALSVSFQLLLVPAWTTTGALADGTVRGAAAVAGTAEGAEAAEIPGEASPEAIPPAGEPPAIGEPPKTGEPPGVGEPPSVEPPITGEVPPPGGPGVHTPEVPPKPPGEVPPKPTGEVTAPSTPSAPVAAGGSGSGQPLGAGSLGTAAMPSASDGSRRKAGGPSPVRARPLPGHGTGDHSADRSRRSSRTHPAEGTENAQTGGSTLGSPQEVPAALVALAGGMPGALEEGPPAYLIPIYQQAGRRYEVPWRVLAAINQIETDYGRNLASSTAGAIGWMQFMPATWRAWAVDADGDGYADPFSPTDAIYTAARYLQASGAASDLPGAIFAYNHAGWYVAEVLLRARLLGDSATFARVERGYALPLDARYMNVLGRTDDGVDIETAPDGALVYSMTAGTVSAVASDPAGFGPNYPVIEATDGPLTGRYVYYGHVALTLAKPGQHVLAGQPIAVMGHTGDAASLGHGHIEIGFSDASGDPLSHHGATASTPAGEVMRGVLSGLMSAFGVDGH